MLVIALGCGLGNGKGAPVVAAAPVTITRVGVRPDRPPRRTVLIDLRVTGAHRARWLLLPTRTDVVDPMSALSVDGTEIWRARSSGGEVAFARFQGRKSFVAIPLPPAGELIVRGLELTSLADLPKDIAFALCDDVRVGDEPISAWTGTPTSTTGEVDARVATRSSSRFTKGRVDVPVTLVGARIHHTQL